MGDEKMLDSASAHAMIGVKDLSRAKEFFSDKLGSRSPRNFPPVLSAMRRAAGTWFLVYESQFAGTAETTCMNHEGEDIEAAVTELRDCGVAFEDRFVVDDDAVERPITAGRLDTCPSGPGTVAPSMQRLSFRLCIRRWRGTLRRHRSDPLDVGRPDVVGYLEFFLGRRARYAPQSLCTVQPRSYPGGNVPTTTSVSEGPATTVKPA
jgi:catechol 2,3-dioxygenase-like lactoylglutathione lyase family enzyme